MSRISDVMTRDVEVVQPNATLLETAQRMRDGNFGMMPVGENDRMVGTISDRDIAVRGVAGGYGGNAMVRDIMSDGVRWAYEDEDVEHAAQLMAKHQIRRLPIVSREKRLVGILALADVAADEHEAGFATQALCGISQ